VEALRADFNLGVCGFLLGLRQPEGLFLAQVRLWAARGGIIKKKVTGQLWVGEGVL